jgi:hypothetical protein
MSLKARLANLEGQATRIHGRAWERASIGLNFWQILNRDGREDPTPGAVAVFLDWASTRADLAPYQPLNDALRAFRAWADQVHADLNRVHREPPPGMPALDLNEVWDYAEALEAAADESPAPDVARWLSWEGHSTVLAARVCGAKGGEHREGRY